MSAGDMTVGSVPYATPVPRRNTAWPGVAVVFGGLALIVLGGCFMIGAMSTINNDGFGLRQPPPSLTSPQLFFVATMYVLATCCFVGAGVMLTIGTRALLRLMRT